MENKFGRLTLLSSIDGRNRLFACDCGEKKIASIYDVRSGKIKSCGCLKRERGAALSASGSKSRVRDLAGQRFGMLVVVERSTNNKHGCATWACRCDCGQAAVVSRNHLVAGNTASCGCAKRDGLVVRPADKRERSNRYVQQRMRTDLKYALNRRLLQLMHASLRARGAKKSDTMEARLGYGVEDLERHLLSTMPAGYTWADFLSGALHIDHKVPLAAFNFQTDTDLDFGRAWALDNLQLLPEAENIAKSDSLSEPFQPSLGM